MPSVSNSQDSDIAKTATVMKLVLNGYAGAGTITLGGFDYHDSTRATGETRNFKAGQQFSTLLPMQGLGSAAAQAALTAFAPIVGAKRPGFALKRSRAPHGPRYTPDQGARDCARGDAATILILLCGRRGAYETTL